MADSNMLSALSRSKLTYKRFELVINSNLGNLDLWAAIKKLSLYRAAIDLCEAAGVEVPWVRRW